MEIILQLWILQTMDIGAAYLPSGTCLDLRFRWISGSRLRSNVTRNHVEKTLIQFFLWVSYMKESCVVTIPIIHVTATSSFRLQSYLIHT